MASREAGKPQPGFFGGCNPSPIKGLPLQAHDRFMACNGSKDFFIRFHVLSEPEIKADHLLGPHLNPNWKPTGLRSIRAKQQGDQPLNKFKLTLAKGYLLLDWTGKKQCKLFICRYNVFPKRLESRNSGSEDGEGFPVAVLPGGVAWPGDQGAMFEGLRAWGWELESTVSQVTNCMDPGSTRGQDQLKAEQRTSLVRQFNPL